MDDSDQPGTLRLFYALWPDDAVRAALVRLISAGPGKPTPAAHMHLTLAFLGNQPAALVPDLRTVLRSLPFTPLALTIDRHGVFSRARILWAGVRDSPELVMLQAQLMRSLAPLMPAGSPPAPRFRPHLTLMRKAAGLPPGAAQAWSASVSAPAFAPIDWHADRIALVASTLTPAGSLYEIVEMRQALA